MNDDSHEQSDLSDFEQRLRSLAPRAPLANGPLANGPLTTGPVLEEFDEQPKVELRSRDWLDSRHGRRAFYRTVALSGAMGAMLGAACMLLIVRWSGVTTQSEQVAVVQAAQDIQHTSVELSSPNGPLKQAVVETPAPRINHTEVGAELPADWLAELRELRPGTLGVGTRLVSQLGRRQGAHESRDQTALSGVQEVPSYIDNNVSDLDRREARETQSTLPQRQWMQRMLSSPREFF